MNFRNYHDFLLYQVVKALVHDEPPIPVLDQLEGWRSDIVNLLLHEYNQGGVSLVRKKCRILFKKHPDFAKIVKGLPFDDLPRAVNAKTLMSDAGSDLQWAIPGLIPEGLTILAGAPKIGKSWLCLDLAIAVATGTPVLRDVSPEAGDVLYLALEDTGRRLRERLSLVLDNRKMPQRLHFISNDQHVPRWDDGGKLFLNQWLAAHAQARMIIVDTLVRFRPHTQQGVGIYERDYHAVQEMARFAAQRRISLLVVHHTRKTDTGDAMHTISGSFGLTGGVDGMVVLRREPDQDDAILHITGRDVEVQAYTVRWNSTTARWSIIGIAAEVKTSAARQAILRAIDAQPHPVTPKQVWESIESDDPTATRAAVRQLMYKMSREGVLQATNGKYSRNHQPGGASLL